MDDLGKSFCVIMCYTVTAIKHKKIKEFRIIAFKVLIKTVMIKNVYSIKLCTYVIGYVKIILKSIVSHKSKRTGYQICIFVYLYVFDM